VSLWIFNRSLLIINELLLYAAKPTQAILSGPWPQYMAQSSGRGACGFVLADHPTGSRKQALHPHLNEQFALLSSTDFR
jgi:hypothetical protein